MDDATRNQIAAAAPLESTWLTANAGSGKTRVLTDRVARLLLAGTEPQRILCLTYTKAAATEMQNRLLTRLGSWAMLPEKELRKSLADLGETNSPDLAEARRLFARAIETPGGLKVQTIHSFCAALLRRFPLESGVPLGFQEIDNRSLIALRSDVIEEMAEEQHPAIRDLTALHGGDRLDQLLKSLGVRDYSAPPDAAKIWSALGLAPGLDENLLLEQVFIGEEHDLFATLVPILLTGNTTDQKLAAVIQSANWQDPGLPELDILIDKFLTASSASEPLSAKIGAVPSKGLQRGACAALMPQIDAMMLRVQAGAQVALSLNVARKTFALHRFAHEFSRRLTLRKAAQGWLDFDDLIQQSARLLRDSAMAQWVLWRLEGGIDHILVDEAQDTSPDQWQLIRSLTNEFTSGIGATDRVRTLFVVGDPKQSIYSFLGADVAIFEQMRDQFRQDFQAVNRPVQEHVLSHSFRSSPAILRLVDAVFQGDAAEGLGGPPAHVAFNNDLPGRVDIWPPYENLASADLDAWAQPDVTEVPDSAVIVLARAIAGQIKDILGKPFFDNKAKQIRALTAGDIQILVQRRSPLFEGLIQECKAANLPVAGADRLKLGADLAVRDILAVMSVLATPEDDLSLAAALRSPLFGLSEDDLYRLAAGRGAAYLWQRLRDSSHRHAVETLNDLMGQADFMRPYDLISRLLNRHGGRASLISRLGAEAEDGINELLSQALAYEQAEPPSLTGFIVWLAGDEIEVKRQLPGGDDGLIRIMTVHGAKGLESPVVILPETTVRNRVPREVTIAVDHLPMWRVRKEERPEPVADAVTAQSVRHQQEQRRLLYVAMTRAESWLIVAAAGKTGEGTDSWHSLVREGAERADLTRSEFDVYGIGRVRRYGFGDWPETMADSCADSKIEPNAAAADKNALAEWLTQPLPAPPTVSRPVAATSLGGAKAIGMGRDGLDSVAAMLRGTRLHLLLEILPERPRADWPNIARDALAGAEGGVPDSEELARLIAEASGVIEAPELSSIMTPEPDATVLREVSLTAEVPGIGILHGMIDRLIIRDDDILAVDYKSNSEVPVTVQATPVGILRQMAAYRAALRQIYPKRVIRSAILWTSSRSFMPLPDELLDETMTALDPDALRS